MTSVSPTGSPSKRSTACRGAPFGAEPMRGSRVNPTSGDTGETGFHREASAPQARKAASRASGS
jgi:hypothetical protein